MTVFLLSTFSFGFYVILGVFGGIFDNFLLSAKHCMLKIIEDPDDGSSSIMESSFPPLGR